MALIKCEECGKEVSDRATTCVNCGCPIEKKAVIPQDTIQPAKLKYSDVTFKECTDIAGSKIIIDGDNIHLKRCSSKRTEDCTFDDIVFINYIKHDSGRVSVDIRTQNSSLPLPYSFIFDNHDTATELYEFLIEKKPQCATNVNNTSPASISPTQPTPPVNAAPPVAFCPKCYSTSLSANKKGFGVGKAILGVALTGGIGLAAGGIGANKVRVTCLNCGHQFTPGK